MSILSARRRDVWQADGIAGLATALAMAVVWIHWLLPPGFLRGVSSYWQTDVTDATQYVSGFNVFLSEPWAWPLLRIQGLNFPEGTLATFVDVIPLYASVLKLLSADRFPFNPYGSWIGLSYLSMAVGAWWLAREARLRGYGVLVALTGLLLVMPALNGRVLLGHVSLTSHWPIVFALALYLRSGRCGRPVLVPWTLLLFGTFYVNLYIFVIAGLVFAADVVRFGASRGWWRTLGGLVLPAGVILASLPVTMWPLPHFSRAPESGFGFYAMNVLSPFVDGGRSTSWMTTGRIWLIAGHYEGYNYLGAGVLPLIAVALALRLRHDRGFFRRHLALLVAFTLVTVFALSSRVYVGERLVLEWPVPSLFAWVFGTFRSSGRLFWVVGYALVCFAVLTCARWLRPRAVTAVLLLALALQWFDLQPIRKIVRTGLKRPAARVLDSAVWDATVSPGVRTIYLYPKFGCHQSEKTVHGILAVQRYAAERRLRLNTGYIARYHPPCDSGPREVSASAPAESVYVFLRGETAAASPADYFPPGARLSCHALDVGVACRWLAGAPQAGPARHGDRS